MRQPTDRFIQTARTFTKRVPAQARRWREHAVRAGREGLPPVVDALRRSSRTTLRAGDSWRRLMARWLRAARVAWETRRRDRAMHAGLGDRTTRLLTALKRPARVRVPLSRTEVVRRRQLLLLGGGTTLAACALVGLIVMAARVKSSVDAGQRAPLTAAGASSASRTPADLTELENKLTRTEGASDDFREAAGDAVGDDAGVYQVMGDWLALQHDRLTDYHNALRSFMAAGSIDASTLLSKDEISFRITLAESLSRASKALTEVFTQGVEMLPERMESYGVSENRAEEEIARLRDRNEWPIALELRHMDEKAMGLFVRYLTLLKQTFGQWTYHEDTGDVDFTEKVTPGTVEEFNNLAGEIRRIARDQAELRGKLAS